MKSRARRVMIVTAVLGAVLVAVLVVANWGTVRDHVEAWHVQLTQETEAIEPNPAWETQPLEARRGFRRKLTRRERADLKQHLKQDVDSGGIYGAECLLEILANSSGCPVILRPADISRDPSIPPRGGRRSTLAEWMLTDAWLKSAGAHSALNSLKADRWRILEQRFPRRAYMVIQEHRSRKEQLLWDGLEHPAPAEGSNGTERP